MKQLVKGSLLFAALLVILVGSVWLQPRIVHAQSGLKVYLQQVKEKQWTDIKGAEIIGFSCDSNHAGECWVASR